MPAESAYREACEAACKWCSTNLPVYGIGDERYHLPNNPTVIHDSDKFDCASPTIEKFAQSQALGRVAAEKRADAAEQEQSRLRIGYANLIRLHDIEKTDMSEQLSELSGERDRLRAVLADILPLAGVQVGPENYAELVHRVTVAHEALATAPATVAEASSKGAK